MNHVIRYPMGLRHPAIFSTPKKRKNCNRGGWVVFSFWNTQMHPHRYKFTPVQILNSRISTKLVHEATLHCRLMRIEKKITLREIRCEGYRAHFWDLFKKKLPDSCGGTEACTRSVTHNSTKSVCRKRRRRRANDEISAYT